MTQVEVSASELKAKKDALKGLTVAQLASYDDFLTDLLVDQVRQYQPLQTKHR